MVKLKMVVSCEAAFPSFCCLPLSPLPNTNTNTNTSTYLFKPSSPTAVRLRIRLKWRHSMNQRTSPAFNTIGVSLQTNHSFWEHPQNGSNSDSESEDEDEAEWVSPAQDNIQPTTPSQETLVTQYEEDLLKEVEQLLEPAERVVLDQNEAPLLSKISTPKWGLLQGLALSGQIPFMDKLLTQGVPIDALDKDGFTALHKAIIGKREAVISHLLRKGANPNLRDKNGATPLHYAAQVGAIQTVKLLIKYKVDVNVADNEGWTPLHVAIQSRCRDIVKVLLLNGADKTRRTNDGKTGLDLSLCYGKDFKSYDLAKLVKLVPADSAI